MIVGLIDLAQRYSRDHVLDLAIQHGNFILDVAEESDAGTSWKTLQVPVRRNLTGYGHGVAGIITALAELQRATGDKRFASAVHEGLRYEQNCYI